MSGMKVDVYERIWLFVAAFMIAGFVGAIVYAAASHAVVPPSRVETIDPTRVRIDSEFSRPRVLRAGDGSSRVVGVAEMFTFRPAVMRVLAGRPVTFRLTSPDVVHGFQIVGTNANLMVVPGYVSEVTTTFPRAGEYLVVCNEYCGLSHHLMAARLIVEEAP